MRNPFIIKYYVMSVTKYNWHTKFKSYLTSFDTIKFSDFVPDKIRCTCWHYDSRFKELMDYQTAQNILSCYIDLNDKDSINTKYFIKKKLCWRGFHDKNDKKVS